jgi:hypothetical protein
MSFSLMIIALLSGIIILIEEETHDYQERKFV